MIISEGRKGVGAGGEGGGGGTREVSSVCMSASDLMRLLLRLLLLLLRSEAAAVADITPLSRAERKKEPPLERRGGAPSGSLLPAASPLAPCATAVARALRTRRQREERRVCEWREGGREGEPPAAEESKRAAVPHQSRICRGDWPDKLTGLQDKREAPCSAAVVLLLLLRGGGVWSSATVAAAVRTCSALDLASPGRCDGLPFNDNHTT